MLEKNEGKNVGLFGNTKKNNITLATDSPLMDFQK